MEATAERTPLAETLASLLFYTLKCIIFGAKVVAVAGIGRRLKDARKGSGRTQIELATATGVGLRTIRRVEQDDFEPKLATARKLAAALGVRVEWLVFGLGPATGEEERRDAGDDAGSGDQ